MTWLEKLRLRLSASWWALKWSMSGDEVRLGDVEAMGSPEFIKLAVAALTLLHTRAPVAYGLVLQNVGTVVEWRTSGVWLRGGRAWALVPSELSVDVRWLARHLASVAFYARTMREEAGAHGLSPEREAQLDAEHVDFLVHVMQSLEEAEGAHGPEGVHPPSRPN